MTDVAFDFLGSDIHSIATTNGAEYGASALSATPTILKEEEDAFSAAISVWRGIHLPDIQKDMDTQSVELLEQQQQSLAGRKKLAEMTREFKKVPDQDKLQQFKALLKAYQAEIDAITKREKASSQAFMNVYNALGQAPDPVTLLKVALDHTSKLNEMAQIQAENARLKDENAALQRQNAAVKSSASHAAKIQQKLTRLESKQEEQIQERVREKEASLREEYEEKIRAAKETEHDLSRQLHHAKDQLKLLRHNHDSTQQTLVDHSQKYEEEVVAKLAELDIVLLDYERANGRISELEGQNELLRQQLDNMQGQGFDNDRVNLLEQTIETQDNELKSLTTAMDNLKTTTKQQTYTLERRVTELQQDIKDKSEALESAKRKLEQYSDYETVKSELEVLKYIEFSSAREQDDDDDWDERVLTLASKHLEKPLEVLLRDKARKLENELTELKVEHDSTLNELDLLRTQYEQISRQWHAQTDLVHRLEEDITRLNASTTHHPYHHHHTSPSSPPPPPPPLSHQQQPPLGMATPASPSFGQSHFEGHHHHDHQATTTNIGGVTLGQIKPETLASSRSMSFGAASASASATVVDPTLSTPPLSTSSPLGGGFGSEPANNASGGGGGGGGILSIVTSQRDRFRQRNGELEAQLREQSEQISTLKNELSQLQKDNLKMYEKIKFMQSYASDKGMANYPNGGAGVGGGFGSYASSSAAANNSYAGAGAGGGGAMVDYSSPFRTRGNHHATTTAGSRKKDDGDDETIPMQIHDPTDRYRNMYEESLNPFEAFHKKEESRRYNDMTVADKAMLSMSRLVLTNKWTRTMLVGYTMGLHFLMAMMLYKMSLWEECRHDHETPNEAHPFVPGE
ncbi:hypothetical protein DFQ26_007323 [Actinomortierella ambigua]|nr:hypothetical protein DFQ26_007323 [Actinomortierella ambigua]